MDNPDSPTTFLLTQGILGIIAIVLSSIIVFLYRKIEKKDLRIEELQELRLQDSKEVVRDVTDVLNGNSQNMRILSEKIEVGKRAAT